MGVQRRGSRSVTRKDLDPSGIESIKRDATGAIQMTNVLNTTGSPVTGITGTATTTTKTSRAFASSATLKVSETGTITAGTVVLKRGGATVVSQTGMTATITLTTSNNTFTASPATWTASVKGVAGGTAKIATWVQKKEAHRS